MGAGASAQPADLSDEEKARITELQALDPEKQKMLAFEAMKDMLTLSVDTACATGSQRSTWEKAEFAIPVPRQGDFDWIAEGIGKIPMVGKSMADAILSVPAKIGAKIIDAACVVSSHANTKAVFMNVISRFVATEEHIALCQTGGGAFTDFLINTSNKELSTLLGPVVAEVLKGHDLTKTWQSAIADYNKAASKLPGIEPLEFDLNEYVMEQILGTIGRLIRQKEAATRAAPGDEASVAIKKIWGSGQRDPADLICSLVLVPQGDPRQIVLAAPALPTKDAPAPIKTARGLSVVLKAPAATTSGGFNWIELGVGQPVEGGLGASPNFYADGKFIVAEAYGETRLIDFAYGRYHDGNAVILANSVKGEKETFKKHRSTEWVVNKDSTISTCRKKDFVLGLRVSAAAAPTEEK